MNPCENNQNSHCFPSKNTFQNIVEINQHYIVKAIEAQNLDKYEESIDHLDKISKNFFLLGSYIDQFPNTPHLIRENREILSQAHLEKFSQLFPIKINNNFEIDKIQSSKNKKAKQQKVKWTSVEHELFLEGINQFGTKKLKQVSELIGTRTVAQVRSHLQKYQIKLMKESEKGNNTDSKQLKNKKDSFPKEKSDI